MMKPIMQLCIKDLDSLKLIFTEPNIIWLNLKLDSHLPPPRTKKKKKILWFNDSPSKMIKNVFLFHLKSFFRSQDTLTFILSFWTCKKNDVIRKIKLISEFMTSQPGYQRITIHILLKISRIKGNQTMKFGQSIEYPKRNVFL